jgi:hypothetical protein
MTDSTRNMLLVAIAVAAGAVAVSQIDGGERVIQPQMSITATAPDVVRSGARPLVIEPAAPLRVRAVGADSVVLRCDSGFRQAKPKLGVAEFRSLPEAGCAVSIGAKSRPFEPVYPGDRVDCRNVAGITSCTGAMADESAARVSLLSEQPGTFQVDGAASEGGELRLRPGRHLVIYTPTDGPPEHWNLEVGAHERVEVRFHPPLVVALAADPG